MESRTKVKGSGYRYAYRQRGTVPQMREEEIEIGERMMLVSDRMRKEVVVLLGKLDSRRGMSAEELRDVVETGLKVVVEAVEKTMTSISDTLTNERKERKDEEKRIGNRLDKAEEREGYKEDRMRKMEERIEEKENKEVDRVRKVEDKLQEEMLDMEDRTKSVEEKVLEVARRMEDRLVKMEEKRKVAVSRLEEKMERMEEQMKENEDRKNRTNNVEEKVVELTRRMEDKLVRMEEKSKDLACKMEEKMERMEGKMKENVVKEERLKAEKEQTRKEEIRKVLEEKVRQSNKQLKYSNIDLGRRITSKKEIVERTIQKMRYNVRTSDRERLDFLLRRTRVVVLGKETALRFIGNWPGEGVYSVPMLLECRSEVEREELEDILRNGGFHSTYHWPEELLEFVHGARYEVRMKGFEEDSHFIRIRPMERKGRIVLKGDVKDKQGGSFQVVAIWELPTFVGPY